MVYRGIDFLGKCCMMNEGETLNFIKYRMFVLEMKPIGVITNRLLFFEVHQMII